MVEEARKDPRLIDGVYQVGQVITTGPILTVYTAYNRNTSDVVGLLVLELPPQFEAEAALRLLEPLERRRLVQSPHVIHVYDWGIDGSRAYIATDPPRGITLRHVLDNEAIDLRRAIDLAKQMTRGLVTLQAQGVVDTDMRPQLITVDIVGDTDRVQLDDVGLRLLLKQLGYVNSQRSDDIGLYDPRYISPEYIQGMQIGPWSDVYQVGLLLFELITGRSPFVGRNPAETRALQSTAPVPRMVQFRHDTPQILQDLVDRALTKEPAQRFLNAEALLKALETIRPGLLGGEWREASSASLTPPEGALPAVSAVVTDEVPSFPAEVDPELGDTLIESGITVKRAPLAAEEEGVYAYLYFEKEGEEARRFAIKDKYVVVGRVDPKRGLRPEIDLTSVDPGMTVSRQHARIRFEKTFFYIEDLKSRNKTRLGELALTPLKAELLQHGDVLQFGSVRMVFKVPGLKEKQV
jgi:protein kinase-like protein/FHA domain-containing protein